MGRIDRIAVCESKAAKMMDMPVSDFRRLVSAGALPPPVKILDVTRWRVSDLESTLSGEAMSEDFEI